MHHPITDPTGEVVLAQFGPRLYVALRSATLRVGSRPEVVEWGDRPTVVSDTLLAILSCPCGAELEVELHTSLDNAAMIARYCLPAGHCTFIRPATPQPPCDHWQPIPFDPATEGTA